MSGCTAPRRGHHTASGRANCPVHGGGGYGYPSRSFYQQPAYRSSSSGSSRPATSGGAGTRAARPSWSPSTSPLSYTPDQVKALTPYRRQIEMRARQGSVIRDVFLCHAWDDRRGAATELNDLLENKDVSVWFSERDIILGQPFMREIDKGLAKSRTGLVLVTPAFLERIENGGVSDKELSALLARDLLIPVVHGTTYEELRAVSPLLGSRHGFDTSEDSFEVIAAKVAEMVSVELLV